MHDELQPDDIARELGAEGVGSLVEKAEEYCAYETRRIELANQATIVALKAEGSLLLDEEKDLKDLLRQAPPPGDMSTRRAKIIYYWAVAVGLTVAGFYFSLLAFDPYRLGTKSYVYCLGLAVVTPFLVEHVLQKWNAERLVKSLTAVGAAAALLGLIALAVVRGDLLAAMFKTVTTNADGTETQPQTDFYSSTLVLLRWVMALVAVAMELGSGLALHEAWRLIGGKSEDWDALRKRLTTVRERLIAVAHETTMLHNEPAAFTAKFWRNFHRAMWTSTIRSSVTKHLLVLIMILAFAHPRALAGDRVTLVVAIDLTQSVAVAGPDGETEFQKNVDGVTRVLAQAPAGARVTVLGITDRTFAQPYIMLRGTVPDDPGYFGERLRAAQAALVRDWKKRSADVKARFRYTDILGALLVAQQVFDDEPMSGRKILIFFSDMRHNTPELDLESPRVAPSFAAFRKRSRGRDAATLTDIEVYVLGVDGAGKSPEYWKSLKTFWTDYFRDSGAELRSYSVLREFQTKLQSPSERR